jgi:tetratricopeptide (TPR) repeat protein
VARAYALASEAAFVSGDYEKAYALAQRAVAEGPTLGNAYATLASIDALQGRAEGAARNMSEHRRLMPHNTIQRYVINSPSGSDTYLAGRDRMIEGLRTAGLPEQ